MIAARLKKHIKGNIPPDPMDFKIRVLFNGRGYQLFELLEPVSFVLTDGTPITAPAGLQIDGKSSPFLVRRLFPMFGKLARAWILHDLLYIIDFRREELGTRKARKLADKEMLSLGLQIVKESGSFVQLIEILLSFVFVRIFGGKVYKKNR